MASSAMRCAEASPKPSRDWQARTSSANAPPPGTTTMGTCALAMASSQAASSPERTTLPPSLTTIGRAVSAAGARSAGARKDRPGMSGASPGAHDLDADGARLLVELLDGHLDRGRARMNEAMRRHLLGHG